MIQKQRRPVRPELLGARDQLLALRLGLLIRGRIEAVHFAFELRRRSPKKPLSRSRRRVSGVFEDRQAPFAGR
jgi:hypothetical protein